jgi:periplasmic protein CpxP/Spy
MKKATMAFLLFLSISAIGFAQENKGEEKMTLEQRNTLRLKKLTLDLNLTVAQQKELTPIIAEQSKKMELRREENKIRKEAKKKLSKDEKFNMANKNLDQQIELKARLSKILNAEQMQKWEEKKELKKKHFKKRRKEHKEKNREESK